MSIKQYVPIIMLTILLQASVIAYAGVLQESTIFSHQSNALYENNIVDNTTLWHYLYSVYSKVERIGAAGLNVTYFVDELNKVLLLIQEGDFDKAYNLLKTIDGRAEEILVNLPNIELYNNMVKYITVGFLLAVPIMFYYLVPRVYIYIWYKTRRQWVIKSDANK